MPRVSVVIPTYNRREFVAMAVESVLAQTFRDYEIIVVDDGSTDGSSEMLTARFGSKIRLERLPRNQGRSSARNVGWVLANGDLVAFLDSDDLWLPAKLARQTPLFDRPEVLLAHCRVGEVDPGGCVRHHETALLEKEFERAARRGYDYGGITETWCRMCTSAVVVRKEVLRRIGGFDPRLSTWEDWDVFWRAAREGEVATVPETLAFYRTHGDNTPNLWTENALPWLEVNRKHLAELDGWPRERAFRRARRNLLVNMSLGEYWRRNLPASRRWMWKALWNHPGLLRPRHSPWAALLVHACLPHSLAALITSAAKFDNYETPPGQIPRR